MKNNSTTNFDKILARVKYKKKKKNMTREELLKYARAMYEFSQTPESVKSALEKEFPELRESENERIRKELLEVIRHCYEDGGYTLCTDDYKKYSFYLEKQKDKVIEFDHDREQKPNPYTGIGFDYNSHHWSMCARDGGVEIIVDGKIRGKIIDKVLFESIERSDSVAKEMFIKTLERAVEQTKKGYELTDCDKHSWWEDFKAYSGIKPAEWSEDIIRKAIKEVGLTQHQINWFKNNIFQPKQEWSKEEKERIRQNGRLDVCYNPEKYGLCHKVEWSEEDERLLNIIIDILDREEHNGHLTLGDLKACVKLLKSLHPIWKPNEEQLQPLEYAIDYFKKKGNDTTYLESLLNDLNKL